MYSQHFCVADPRSFKNHSEILKIGRKTPQLLTDPSALLNLYNPNSPIHPPQAEKPDQPTAHHEEEPAAASRDLTRAAAASSSLQKTGCGRGAAHRVSPICSIAISLLQQRQKGIAESSSPGHHCSLRCMLGRSPPRKI